MVWFFWFFTIRICGSRNSYLGSLATSSDNLNLLNFALNSDNSDWGLVALLMTAL